MEGPEAVHGSKGRSWLFPQYLGKPSWLSVPGERGGGRGDWRGGEGRGGEGPTCSNSSRQPQSLCSSALASVTDCPPL